VASRVSAPDATIEDACQTAWAILLRSDHVTLDERGAHWLPKLAIREGWRLASTARDVPVGVAGDALEAHGWALDPRVTAPAADELSFDRVVHERHVADSPRSSRASGASQGPRGGDRLPARLLRALLPTPVAVVSDDDFRFVDEDFPKFRPDDRPPSDVDSPDRRVARFREPGPSAAPCARCCRRVTTRPGSGDCVKTQDTPWPPPVKTGTRSASRTSWSASARGV
jgi:hypothetical protein